MKEIGLYYPHTKIRDPRMLKGAMLIWDSVEIIVPNEWHQLGADTDEVRHVIKETKFLRSRIPEYAEKNLAGEEIARYFLQKMVKKKSQIGCFLVQKLRKNSSISFIPTSLIMKCDQVAGVAKEITKSHYTDMALNRSSEVDVDAHPRRDALERLGN